MRISAGRGRRSFAVRGSGRERRAGSGGGRGARARASRSGSVAWLAGSSRYSWSLDAVSRRTDPCADADEYVVTGRGRFGGAIR